MASDKVVNVIEARGLVKSFPRANEGPVRAVDGIDLSVPAGQTVALVGPNGAGKTTTVDMLLGLVAPDSGSARVAGLAPRAAVLSGKVAAVLQSGGLLADLTVGETVRLIASTFENPRPVGEVMERAGISHLAKRRVSRCSGGERQRLRFALALLPEPDVLIMDEPTTGMDAAARRDFWDTVQLDALGGRTVLFVTHYLEEVDAFADRVVILAKGRVVADGPTDEVRAAHSGRTVTADIPVERSATALDYLARFPGVYSVAVEQGRVSVTAEDTDAVALGLLRDLGAANLGISHPTLDAVFLSLTSEEESEGGFEVRADTA